MADDKLFNDNKDAPAGGLRFPDPATGASTYMEKAADSGEIDLDDLLSPPDQPPLRSELQGFVKKPEPAGHPVPNQAAGGLASDFPEAALSGGAAAAPAPESPKGGRTIIYNSFYGFFGWFRGLWSAIPPLEDIFDSILASLGLQRKPASMLRRAHVLAHKGRLVEAISRYREVLLLRPLTISAYDGLGRAYFRMGLTEEADREFTIADSLERILHNRDDIEAAASLASAFLERKQPKISVSLIEPVLIAHFYSPNNRELLKAMGRVYTELRASKKMYQVLSAGLAQHPEDYEFYIMKGNAEIKLGNISVGERLIRQGRLMKKLKENPEDASAKMALGELLIKDDRIEEGMRRLREAAQVDVKNTGVRWRLFHLDMKQKNPNEALKYLLEIIDIEPENEELQYRLAEFYRRHHHKEEAVDIYRALIDRHPRDPRPHSLLGETLNELGSFEEGQRMKVLAQTLEGGLKANPDHKETVAFMKYLFSTGQTEEANEWLERGLARWPYHGELVLTKVKQLYNEYRYKEAVAMLKGLIATKPNVAEPHIWIAMCYQRLGDNMAALAEAQLATRLAPKSFTAHKVLGDVLKEQKKLSQANAAYEVAEMMRHAHERK